MTLNYKKVYNTRKQVNTKKIHSMMAQSHRLKSKKSFEFDYDELNRKLTKRKVLDQVADMIEAERPPSEKDSTSNLYRILVKKLKVKISELEDDPKVCEVASKKLARWVEGMMKEAYGMQRLKNLNWTSKSSISSITTSLRKSRSSHTLDATGEGPRKDVMIEKVRLERPLSFERTGQVFSTNLDGRKVYVEEVKDGNRLRALVSREKPNIQNPLVREWSTWMVDLAAKTQSWVKKIEDNKEESWDCLMDEPKTDSVIWRKRKIESDPKNEVSTDSIWSQREQMEGGRNPLKDSKYSKGPFLLPSPPKEQN